MSAELDVRPIGERALRVAIGADVDRAALVSALRAEGGVLDACTTETHALVVFEGAPPDLRAAFAAAAHAGPRAGALHVVEVVLDGVDRPEVVRAAGLESAAALASALEACELSVSFLGFCPGFAYLRGLDPRLSRLERRASPRAVVPAGSLAIAGGFAGIYPFATPGGWNLVGRALGPIFEGARPRFAAGDRVRLVVVPGAPASAAAARPEASARRPGLRVAASAPVFVQDLGRPGRLSEGIPRGGALVPAALVRANRLAGAPDDAAALERFGPLVLEAGLDARLATDDGLVFELRAGQSARFDWGAGRRVGYVAVGGGLEVPSVLGGRGTLVSAGLGGHEGRALRRGDVLVIGDRHARWRALEPAPPRPAGPIVLSVVPGPDTELCAEGALERLCASEWRVSQESSRTGIRLEGPPIPRREGTLLRTVPMVAGAIELPPSGAPIVLGPEHPTTGGYPVLCVATEDGLEGLCASPVGAAVRFVTISAEAARARRATLAHDR